MQYLWKYFDPNLLGNFNRHTDDENITNALEDVFIHQETNYDCGIACIRMALNTKKLNSSKIESKLIDRNSPLWTIDLYYQLRILNVDCCLYTRYAFIRDELYNYEWYQKHGEDKESATAKFQLCKVCCMLLLLCSLMYKLIMFLYRLLNF